MNFKNYLTEEFSDSSIFYKFPINPRRSVAVNNFLLPSEIKAIIEAIKVRTGKDVELTEHFINQSIIKNLPLSIKKKQLTIIENQRALNILNKFYILTETKKPGEKMSTFMMKSHAEQAGDIKNYNTIVGTKYNDMRKSHVEHPATAWLTSQIQNKVISVEELTELFSILKELEVKLNASQYDNEIVPEEIINDTNQMVFISNKYHQGIIGQKKGKNKIKLVTFLTRGSYQNNNISTKTPQHDKIIIN